MPPKQSANERAKALEEFRHEQTVKRWQKGNTKKASKVIYVSDFLGSNAGSGGGAAKGKAEIAPGTFLLGGHRGGGYGGRSGPGPGAGTAKAETKLGRNNWKRAAKQKNPQAAGGTYNHRKQFTALKRRIHERRKAELLSLTIEKTVASHPLEAAAQMVREMEMLQVQLDVAMKERRFDIAGRLKRQIRHHRFRLQRALRFAESGEDDDSDGSRKEMATSPSPAEAEAPPAQEGEAIYVNHFPPTVLLGVGRHPRQADIDRRTGRYPVKIPSSVISAFLLNTTKQADDGDEALAACCAGEAGEGASIPGPARNAPPLFVSAYCRNNITDFLDDLAFTTMQALYAEQRELRQKQPMQFKARQRYVIGFNETLKHLRAGRVKLVVMAADIEVVGDATPQPGQSRSKFQTLDEAIGIVAALCAGGGPSGAPVPTMVTCMSRQRLSYALFAKGSSVSCVGVLHAEKNLALLKALRLLSRGLSICYMALNDAANSGRDASLVH